MNKDRAGLWAIFYMSIQLLMETSLHPDIISGLGLHHYRSCFLIACSCGIAVLDLLNDRIGCKINAVGLIACRCC